MESENPLDKLFQSIGDYLENDPVNFNKFNLLKSDFLGGHHHNSEIYDEIAKLISNNELLLATLESAKSYFDKIPSPSDVIGQFTLYYTKQLSDSPEKILLLTRITSLFVAELINFDFLEYYINQISTPKLFDEPLKSIKTILNENNKNISRKPLAKWSKLPNEIIYYPTSTILEHEKLFVYIPILVDNKEKQQSILKCLKLFGLKYISFNSAHSWLSQINEFLAIHFDNCINQLNIEPHYFIPTSCFKSFSEKLTEVYLIWAFGTDFYSLLKKMPEVVGNSSLQIYNAHLLEKNKHPNKHVSQAAMYIAELQSIKFFTTLKSIGSALKNEKILITSIPEGVIESLFGRNCNLDKNETFYQILIEKCYEKGKEATEQQMKIISSKYEQLNPTSANGRIQFHHLTSPSLNLRSLVFNGTTIELPETNSLKMAVDLTREIVSKFTNLLPKYDCFVEMIQSAGQYDIDENAALAVFYFMEMSTLINNVGEILKKEIKQLPRMIFEESAPLMSFESDPICNIDILIKNFVKYLNKVNEEQLNDKLKPHFNRAFVFHLEVGTNIVMSKGIINTLIV